MKFLQSDQEKLKSLFLSNRYTKKKVDRFFNPGEKEKPNEHTKCPVYLKLPWTGQISETIGQSIKLMTEQTFFCR